MLWLKAGWRMDPLLLSRWRWLAPTLFDRARALLRRQAACLSLPGWMGGNATFRHVQSTLEQTREAFNDLSAVAMLTAGSLRGEVQDTSRINVRFQLAQHTRALRLIQAGRAEHIEGQLDLRGSAIDMLSPWTTAAAELKVEFSQWYRHCLGNSKVGVG
jgi:hypothetical protein